MILVMILLLSLPAGLVGYRRRGPALALAVGALAAAVLGAQGLAGQGARLAITLPTPLPAVAFGLNGLAGWWLLLAGILLLAAAIVDLDRSVPPARAVLFHLLLLGIAVLVTARDPLGILGGWEAISAASVLLVLTAGGGLEVSRAGFMLLGFAELGSALVYAALIWALSATGGSSTVVLAGPAAVGVSLLGILGFGTKGGLFPFYAWMPKVEPEASGEVAGVLSGLATAMALAGIIELLAMDRASSPVVGITLVGLGLAGAVGGALFGLVDRDAKRVLAFGSVEVMGLAFTGLGVSVWARSVGLDGIAADAAVAAVVLVSQHAGAKMLLFVMADHVERVGRGRALERMGGMLRRMPRLGALGLVAMLALSAVPPLGGFVGEWMLLESLLMPWTGHPHLDIALGLVGAVLAIVAAAGLTLYLRWFGMVMLGPDRGTGPVADRRPPSAVAGGLMLIPAVAVGVGAGWLVPAAQSLLGALGRGPALVAPLAVDPRLNPTLVGVGAALFRFLPGVRGTVLTPDGTFSIASPWDLTWMIVLVAAVTALVVRRGAVRRVPPWIGGREGYRARDTFTADALTHPLRLTFAAMLGLTRRRGYGGDDLGPERITYRLRVHSPVDRHVLQPLGRNAARVAAGLVRLQSERVSRHVALVLGALLVSLAVLTSVAH